MPLAAGKTLAHYEILGPLGAGGMGEVYRARDTRLGREVAIKVLPEELAGDEERLARFEREARTLASLNHTNVAGIHGVDQQGNVCFLALELVPGEDLAARLSRGALPVDEAIDVCRQIAEGLEAAHEAGVVHRDLKPANVRLTPDGTVKLIDFGLSKPIRPRTSDGRTSTAETDSFVMTEAGTILGTPTYMSPEQARGRPVDRRTDVWAFGCVLYECLTGRRAFAGDSVADVLAAVVEREPDWSALPSATPPHVRRLLRRCLVKDPRQRLRDAGDARLELEAAAAPETAPASVRRTTVGVIALALLVGALGVFVGLRLRMPSSTTAPPRTVRRFALGGLRMPVDAFQGLALSPDGKRMVYRARGEDDRERLYLRTFDSFEATPLPGTELGWLPFFSPDGRQVGTFARGQLFTVAIAGGNARSIANLDGDYAGAAWMADDHIVFTNTSVRHFLRVPASGGAVETLGIEGSEDVAFVVAPAALPVADAFLCGVNRGEHFDVAVYTIADHRLAILATDAFSPAWSASGHVLFQQGQSGPLMALPFDPARRVATGPAFPVVTDVGSRVSYQVRTFAVADDGTLVYIPRTAMLDRGAIVWVDQEGREEPITEIDRLLDLPRLSHDGQRIAFRTPAPKCDVWVHDLARGSTTRATHEGDNHGVAWSPDDRRLVFARLVDADWEIYDTPADGSGTAERHSSALSRAFVTSLAPDGRRVLVGTRHEATGLDVELVDLGSGTVTPLLHSRFDETGAVFSPDGKLIAYTSNESGREEVYVQPFPALDARVPISTGGGTEPAFSRDGATLYFRDGPRMMAVDLRVEPGLSAGVPSLVFEGDYSVYASRSASGPADYDVSPDGERFVMVRSRTVAGGAEVHVVLDAFAETERLPPSRSE